MYTLTEKDKIRLEYNKRVEPLSTKYEETVNIIIKKYGHLRKHTPEFKSYSEEIKSLTKQHGENLRRELCIYQDKINQLGD